MWYYQIEVGIGRSLKKVKRPKEEEEKWYPLAFLVEGKKDPKWLPPSATQAESLLLEGS